jgi:hypothetical protein
MLDILTPKTSPAKPHRGAWQAIAWSQWAFWCQVAVALLAQRFMPAGGLRSALILAPLLTVALVMGVAVWIHQDSDEYIRSRMQRAAMLTAVTMALLGMAWCFFELLGFPRLSMVWPVLLGWGLFCVQLLPLAFGKE